MKKKFLTLTKEQKDRGVIFSSELVGGGIIHEVMGDDDEKNIKIKRLMDDGFFNGSPYKYNLIRR